MPAPKDSNVLVKLVWRILGGLNFALLFACMFFIGNILPFISKIVVKPLFPGLHEQLKSTMADILFKDITDWAEVVGGLQVLECGDKIPVGSCILISNHVSYTDSIAIHTIARRRNEIGHVRPFAKRTLAYVPIFGWFGVFINYIFLSRSWDKDRNMIRRQLHELVRKAKLYSTGNFWLMLFPEGTRMRPKKLAEAQAFAKKRDLPVLDNLLVPRLKGFVSAMDGTREAIDGVIDITIGYSHFTKSGHARPSVGDMMFSHGNEWEVHTHIKYHPIKTLPTGEEAEGKWLQERWVEKDKLLAAFHKDGHFPGDYHLTLFNERSAVDAGQNGVTMIILAVTMYFVCARLFSSAYAQDWSGLAALAKSNIEALLLPAAK